MPTSLEKILSSSKILLFTWPIILLSSQSLGVLLCFNLTKNDEKNRLDKAAFLLYSALTCLKRRQLCREFLKAKSCILIDIKDDFDVNNRCINIHLLNKIRQKNSRILFKMCRWLKHKFVSMYTAHLNVYKRLQWNRFNGTKIGVFQMWIFSKFFKHFFKYYSKMIVQVSQKKLANLHIFCKNDEK